MAKMPAYEQFNNTDRSMNYAVQQGGQEVHLTTMPTVVNVQPELTEFPPEPWGWCNMVTAIFSLVCCACSPFGLLSTIFATFSWIDYRTSKFKRFMYHRKVAYVFGITAIVIGSIILLIIIIAVVVAVKNIQNARRSFYGEG